MIEFERALWKNFLSTGNSPNEIILNAAPTTLIMGKNGHGKSTILDVLCFCLYGKPFRNISKHQLTNSKNGKNAHTEVQFKTQGKTYKVIRTIKPNNFQIFCDDKLITEDASVKDYQKVLEQQILKMNYKTFTQVVILGSSSFTPFMQLSAGHRREVIDDILDIKILSVMGTVLKAQITETKDALKEIELEIASLKQQVLAQKKLIATMEAAEADRTEIIDKKIADLESQKIALEKARDQLTITQHDVLDKINNFPFSPASFTAVSNSLVQDKTLMDQLDERLDFFNCHDTCPVCEQGISHKHKSDIVQRALDARQGLDNEMERNEVVFDHLKRLKAELDSLTEDLKNMNRQILSIGTELCRIRNEIIDLQTEKNNKPTKTGDIDKEKQTLKDLAQNVVAGLEKKIELTEKRNLQEIASTMLKDGGIKTKIIKEYLPLMNKFINRYLQAQDCFIQFEMNEEFNETIKSRYRDEFTYASFSEGEKQRIDLSILFTWRQIARLKNSAHTNLLILDEIMDGSLDAEGSEAALKLIDSLSADGTHVFVVSHSTESLIEKFDRTLQFEKKNDYSTVTTFS